MKISLPSRALLTVYTRGRDKEWFLKSYRQMKRDMRRIRRKHDFWKKFDRAQTARWSAAGVSFIKVGNMTILNPDDDDWDDLAMCKYDANDGTEGAGA